MKKSFLSILLISFLVLLVSCGNLFNQNQVSNVPAATNGNLTLQIQPKSKLLESQFLSRTVSPASDITFSDVKTWTLTVKSTADSTVSYSSSTEISLKDSSINITLPVGGIYDISLSGTKSIEGLDVNYTYEGTLSNMAITSDNLSVTKDLFVELKKTDEGKGHFMYTIHLPSDVVSPDYNFSLNLKNLDSNLETVCVLGIQESLMLMDGSLILHGIELPSAFYEAKLYYWQESEEKKFNLVLFDSLIEIADNLSTQAETQAYAYTSRTYYATTEATSYNGLTPSYPINIKTLFEKIEDDAIQAKEVKIYLPEGTNLKTNNIVVPMVSGSLKLYVYIGNGLFYNGDAGYVSEVYVSEEGNDNGTGQSDSPLATFGAVWDFVKLYAGTESDITIHVAGEVKINEANRCEISKVKSVTIKGNDQNSDSIVGNAEGKYYGDGNGLCFSNVETINISDIAIKDIIGGTNSASSQCAGLRFDGKTNIKNVNLTGCTFSGNTKGSVGESILIIGGTTTPITFNVKSCYFNGNGLTGSNGNTTSGVIKVLDANVNMTIESCNFSGNGKPDLNISADQTHDYEPVITIKNTSCLSNDDGSANIVYKTGKLNLDINRKQNVPAKIQVGNGKTVNLISPFFEDGGAGGDSFEIIALLPENYAQAAPIIAISEGMDFAEQKAHFELVGDEYSISTDGYIESELVKHITPANYSTFTKENLIEGITLVIHSGFYPEVDGMVNDVILSNFFRDVLQNHEISDLTIDMSGCEDEVWRYLRFHNVPTKVVLPKNLSNWYLQTFENCNNLREIAIDSSNEKYMTIDGVLYEKGAAGNPVTLVQYPAAKEGETYTFPDTVTKINGSGVFAGTRNLHTITNFEVIEDLGMYGNGHFGSSGIKKLVFNDAIKTIPGYMFNNSTIEEVVLPAQLKTIEELAFTNCENLKSVTFRNPVPPTFETYMNHYQFENCPNLEQINVPGTDLSVVSAYQAALPETVRSKVALYLPTGNSINVTEALTDGFIITPESYDYAYPIITFADGVDPTTNLEKIHLSDSTYHIDETGRIASDSRKTVTLGNLETKFGSVDDLTSGMTLVIDSSLAAEIEVGDGEKIPVATEFFCGVLYSNDKCITLDLSSYKADSYSKLAFMNSAEKIILPDTLEDLCYDAFDSEQQLYEIEISKNNPNYVTIEGVLYKKDASGNPSVLVRYPPDRYGESFTLPETVTSIGSAVFAYAKNLKTVTNFNQITKCEDSSRDHFRGSAVSSIELGENLTELGTAMFRECRYISSITIPAGVAKINANCFESCSNLTSIIFMGSVPPFIGDDAFLGCDYLTDIYVPASAVEAYKGVLPEELKENVRAN